MERTVWHYTITVKYSTVQYNTAQYSSVQYCTVHHNTKDPHFWPKPMHLLFARPVIEPPMGESQPKCQGVSSPPLHDSSKLRGNPFSRPSVCVYCAFLNWSLQRHLWTYWGNVLGVKTTKVTPLHLLHTSTTFGANVSYRLQMTRTDRPTDQPSKPVVCQPLGLAMTQYIITDVNVIIKA